METIINRMQNTYSKSGLVLDISGQKLQETGRDIIIDKSRHMNHGMCINETNIIQTKEGTSALSFNGVNDYVDCGNDTSLNVGNILSIEVWIRANNLSSRHVLFSTRKDADTGSFVLEVGTGNGGTNRVTVNSPGVWNLETQNNAIFLNSWYHIVYTKSGTEVGSQKLYINGISQSLLTDNPQTFVDNDAIKLIGSISGTSNFFHGLIDEVRIYNRTLSAEEVRGNMFASKRYKYMRGIQKCGVQ